MRAKGVDAVVVALCADFSRRQAAIEARCSPVRVDMEHRYLNFKIHEAVRRVCKSEDEAEILIEEIGTQTGYARSRTDDCELTYKRRKRRAMDAIAEALYLK